MKCLKCGRKGLFFKVNEEGFCDNCAALIKFEKRKMELETDIQELEGRRTSEEADFERIRADKENIYADIKTKAEESAIKQAENKLSAINSEYQKVSSKLDELKDEHSKLTADNDSVLKKYLKMKTLFESYQQANKSYIKDGENHLDESFLNSLSPTVEIELKCLSIKQLRSLYNQNNKLIQDCLERYQGRYTTKTNAALYTLMTIALKAELQNILYCISFGKLESSIEAIKKMTQKYLEITTEGNQSIAPTIKKFIGEIEYLFIEAVKIEYEYYVQKERIKEEQRAIKEQMRQEAEERKALEQERKRMEKEEQKYRNEIESIKILIENSDDEKAKLLKARISELEGQIEQINDKREQILSLENGKAGYVYIISNIGSFGENVYKIGMTRRMDPMERVNELGSASVPFPFDVHGLIFSDDAVGLEHELHTLFNNNRVNKINLRKEFFKVPLDEIEKLVDERCPTAEFRKTALAEQYRQSLVMLEAAAELDEEILSEKI